MSNKSNPTEALLQEVSESLKSISGSLKTIAEKSNQGKTKSGFEDVFKTELAKLRDALAPQKSSVNSDILPSEDKIAKTKSKAELHAEAVSDKKSEK